MAKRCPSGSTRIGRRLALRVLDWHGGQWEPTYAVGSSGLADQCVEKRLVYEAVLELRRTHRQVSTPDSRGRFSNPKKERDQLARLVEILRQKAMPYEGSD